MNKLHQDVGVMNHVLIMVIVVTIEIYGVKNKVIATGLLQISKMDILKKVGSTMKKNLVGMSLQTTFGMVIIHSRMMISMMTKWLHSTSILDN